MIDTSLRCSDRVLVSRCLLVGSGICDSTYQNHVIDPTFFLDAINEFAFDYTLFVAESVEIDQFGFEHTKYFADRIHGSLQSSGSTVLRAERGNLTSKSYSFYCSSLYRINIGDVLYYQKNFFIVASVRDYDEWGCRECSLESIQLSQYQDLADYLKFIEGERFI